MGKWNLLAVLYIVVCPASPGFYPDDSLITVSFLIVYLILFPAYLCIEGTHKAPGLAGQATTYNQPYITYFSKENSTRKHQTQKYQEPHMLELNVSKFNFPWLSLSHYYSLSKVLVNKSWYYMISDISIGYLHCMMLDHLKVTKK